MPETKNLHLKNGFRDYSMNVIPLSRDPLAVDEKLLALYGIDLSPYERWQRKKSGLPSVHYLRFRLLQVLFTNSLEENALFAERERSSLRYAPACPLVVSFHSLSVRAGHVCVEIERNALAGLYRHFESMAHYARPALIREFQNLPFERYEPVIRQLRCLVLHVNRLRRKANLSQLGELCFGRKRTIYRPFDSENPIAVLGYPQLAWLQERWPKEGKMAALDVDRPAWARKAA